MYLIFDTFYFICRSVHSLHEVYELNGEVMSVCLSVRPSVFHLQKLLSIISWCKGWEDHIGSILIHFYLCLKLEVVCSFITFVTTYKTTQLHNPEDNQLQSVTRQLKGIMKRIQIGTINI